MVQIPMPMEWFLSFTGAIFILLVWNIIVMWAAPVKPFLKARILPNRGLVLLVMRNEVAQFISGRYKAGSATLETKNHGDYYMMQGSKYLVNGVMTSIAYEDYGINLPKEAIVGANLLRAEGLEPEDVITEAGGFRDYGEVLARANDEEEEVEGVEE